MQLPSGRSDGAWSLEWKWKRSYERMDSGCGRGGNTGRGKGIDQQKTNKLKKQLLQVYRTLAYIMHAHIHNTHFIPPLSCTHMHHPFLALIVSKSAELLKKTELCKQTINFP